jgi:acetyl esterase/lipase
VIGHDLPYPKEASIMGGITSTFPPTRVFCAVKDSLIPVEQSYHLIRHLQSLGVDAKAVIVEEAEHGFTDLPVAYFPDHSERWWAESIRPTLEWGLEKLQ